MSQYEVRVYASEVISVEADTPEKAKELAAEESYFSAVDYCEIENEE